MHLHDLTETEFDELYGGSKYLGAGDLNGGAVQWRIGKVGIADLRDPKDGSTKKKYVLFFDGQDKGLPLNKTNAMALATAYGKAASGWVGQVAELYTEMTGIGKPGIRVRPLRKPATPAALNPGMDDAIPF